MFLYCNNFSCDVLFIVIFIVVYVWNKMYKFLYQLVYLNNNEKDVVFICFINNFKFYFDLWVMFICFQYYRKEKYIQLGKVSYQ